MLVLLAALLGSVLVRSGSAVGSHFRPDGAPLSELSWSSSLAVVAISFSGLFAFVFLLLACVCCKKGKIGFKEFQNVYGDDYSADVSTLASPASQDSPDVYVLPLTQVSLPTTNQPARSVPILTSADLGRHSLCYLKEIGTGWFGKVVLGKINSELNPTQVVVKELRTNAGVRDQILFLDEAQPFRTLQHPALLQCLAQITETTPYLLVMEFCPLGDVKGYLRSCRSNESITPDPLTLQRMACEISSGLLHLHKYNFTHSDLALRNCLLTVDISVKIGDYGLAHTKYKDDYYVTWDQIYVPLRWIAPELVEESHGDVVVLDQTLQSNIWSLGVTLWELFELGNQPFSCYSDRQVLTHAVRQRPLRLEKPQLNLPLADRWYEVMQFCWLQPNQRPNAEEVHMLLSYLCAKGASEAEEDFDRRWNSLCPNNGCNGHHGVPGRSMDHRSSIASSFPLLEQFSTGDAYQSSETGDDVLTVTETSHGLNFEYKWEQSRADQSCSVPPPSGSLDRCQEAFYPPGSIVGGCPLERVVHGVSPSYYQAPNVRGAHSPSLRNDYDIGIEESLDCNIPPDYTMCTYSPDFIGNNGSCTDSDECPACPAQLQEMGSYWSANIHKFDLYDSTDSSPAISLTMEPLLGYDSSPLRPWESSHYVSYKDRDGGYYYENSPPLGVNPYRIGSDRSSERHQESWGSRSLRQALGELENPLGMSPSVDSSPDTAYRDLFLDTGQTSVLGRKVTGGYYDMMGSLRKTMPSHSVRVDMETEGAIFTGRNDSEVEEEDVFVERHTCNTWPSKHRRSNAAQPRPADHGYGDFHRTVPGIKEAWTDDEHNQAFYSLPKPVGHHKPHQATKDGSGSCLILGTHHRIVPSNNPYIYLCHQGETQVPASVECCHSHFVDPLAGLLVRNDSYSRSSYIRDKAIDVPSNEEIINLSPAPGGPIVSRPDLKKSEDFKEHCVDLIANATTIKPSKDKPITLDEAPTMAKNSPLPRDNVQVVEVVIDPQPELSHTSNSSMADLIPDCNDKDDDTSVKDVISSFFDESSETNAFKPPQKEAGTPDSMDSLDMPSAAGSCDGLGPASPQPGGSTKAADSGYDTENNESPEFVPKESYETRLHPQGSPTLDAELEEGEGKREDGDVTPFRDSTYFSDYENETKSRRDEEELEFGLKDDQNGEREEKTGATEEEEVIDPAVSKGLQLESEGVSTGATESFSPPETEEFLADDFSQDDPCWRLGSPDKWPLQEDTSSLGDWAAEVVGAMEKAIGALNFMGDEEESDDETKDSTPVKTSGISSKVFNSLPNDEVASQQTGNPRSLSPSPPPGTADLASPADDSDEPGDELGNESVQSGGEEGEDEWQPVPIVVSDTSDAHKLRSLLRTPLLPTAESLEEELRGRKKTVSFFDDVTLHLFDEESPTKENEFPPETMNQRDGGKTHETMKSSEEIRDGNISEETAGLQCDDDFQLFPLPVSSETSDSHQPRAEAPPPGPAVQEAPPPGPVVQNSRFSVSPSSTIRFSITTVSDQDSDSNGGRSEDGQKD
ncbi:serine/threonine-protein kinase LMTK1 [Cololabis saira]|uniref:serine/threonine-protein kinase LMTK1 n=1 Tax=Cololabis saira TaxID=129043 RepID=UPI002AD3F39F|nr:serine/threonine-protein kinase LMTK1 [Cololabis saira]